MGHQQILTHMERDHLSFIEDNEKVINRIRIISKEHLIKSGRKSVVLGVSGGIDSALVAALISPVCDEIGIPLIGVSLPSNTNDKTEIVRAKNIGTAFCNSFAEISIGYEYSIMEEVMYFSHQTIPGVDNIIENETTAEKNIRNGNIKARIRMINLFNIAKLTHGLVLSTDNYTEYLLGFFTIFGDQGDLGIIQELWKTEVYNISEFLCDNELKGKQSADNLRACINCHATDGLGISKSDLDQIMPDWNERHKTSREGYKEVDEVLQSYLRDGTILPGKDVIVDRYLKTTFKRNHPINILRIELI